MYRNKKQGFLQGVSVLNDKNDIPTRNVEISTLQYIAMSVQYWHTLAYIDIDTIDINISSYIIICVIL